MPSKRLLETEGKNDSWARQKKKKKNVAGAVVTKATVASQNPSSDLTHLLGLAYFTGPLAWIEVGDL